MKKDIKELEQLNLIPTNEMVYNARLVVEDDQ